MAGRLINVYSENNYIFAFLYRTLSIQWGIAGFQAILGADGVENVNATNIVGGHLRDRYVTGSILRELRWESFDEGQVDRDEKTPALFEDQDKALRSRTSAMQMPNAVRASSIKAKWKKERARLNLYTCK